MIASNSVLIVPTGGRSSLLVPELLAVLIVTTDFELHHMLVSVRLQQQKNEIENGRD